MLGVILLKIPFGWGSWAIQSRDLVSKIAWPDKLAKTG
jgi:hypothetical protein